MIIYKATNKKNGKIYIGQTINSLKERNKSRKYGDTIFDRAFKKYGEDGFEWEIIDSSTNINCLNKKESFWIEFYNSTNLKIGYNLQGGGYNAYKTDYVKKKIGYAQRGEKSHSFGMKYGLNYSSKRLICVETGKIFESGTHARDLMKLKSEFPIYKSCQGYRNKGYGFKFRYLDNNNEIIKTKFDTDYIEKDNSIWCLNDNKYFKTFDECSYYYNISKDIIYGRCDYVKFNMHKMNFELSLNKGLVFVRNLEYEEVMKTINSNSLKRRNATFSMHGEIICNNDGRIFNSVDDILNFYTGFYNGIKGFSKETIMNYLTGRSKSFRFCDLSFSYINNK